MFPLLKTVLELTFRDGLEYARRIILNRRFVIESLSFEWFFEFWKQPKVTGSYVGTVRRLSKECDTVFTQKLLQKIRWMRWRIIVMEKPVITWPKVQAFSSHCFTQTFQNLNVVFFIDCLTCRCIFVVHNNFIIEKSFNIDFTLLRLWRAIFEPLVPLLSLCYAYTFVYKGLLHHLNSFRIRFSELKTKFDTNSLILFFSHF